MAEPDKPAGEPGKGQGVAAAPRRAGFGGLLRPLAILDGALARFEAVVLALGILLMALNTMANVLGRFLLGESIFFATELNQFLIVLITFIGVGYAVRHGRHIRMSAIYDALPDGLRKVLMVAICLVTAAAMFVLAWYAYLYVASVADTGRIAPSLRIPVYLTLLWVPVGFVITGIQYILTAVANLTRKDVYISATLVDSYDETEAKV